MRVLLADDHAIVRTGLLALIEGEPGVTLAGEATDGLEALRACRELRPDVLVGSSRRRADRPRTEDIPTHDGARWPRVGERSRVTVMRPEDDAAEERRRNVDPRVLFAAERTFLAWLRTALALMGFGFVVARFGLFLRELHAGGAAVPPTGFSRWFGVALIALGVAVTAGSSVDYVLVLRRLARGAPMPAAPARLGIAVACLLIVMGVCMTVYLAAYR